MSEEMLSMRNIVKVYPNGFMANKGINFTVKKGEIHALLGENGAGKTTLMNILFGLETHEEGEIYIEGKRAEIHNPLEAIQNGIGMVHQHFKLIPSLTIAENVVLGMEPESRPGVFDLKEAAKITRETAEKYNMNIDPYATIESVSVGVKQQVEIIKILVRGARILVLDEPTAVLTPQETQQLFKELKHLRDEGNTIIFISHKLNEVEEICDTFTVLRRGELVGSKPVAESSASEMSAMMIGKNIDLEIHKEEPELSDERIRFEGVDYVTIFGKKKLEDISFNVYGGEVMGIAAIEGNGQNEVAEILSGLLKYQNGRVLLSGEDIKEKSIRSLREAGMAYISNDRYKFGCAGLAPIRDNLVADRYFKTPVAKGFMIQNRVINEIADGLIEEYDIRCKDKLENASSLSGGNAQKLIVAREFTNHPRAIIANQPTRGIDIGSSQMIRERLVSLSREQKVAVLLISADLTELLEVSDKIIVLHNGKIAAYIPDINQIDEFVLGEYMLGAKHQTPEEVRCAIH
ncbi:MAG: ABC transporter ATP-binding protein [Lachnospiraceae bacterium]|nr:ABC transporter ATP-binding protein [Lachnospiraceae bacterium]